ncbi:lsm domain containing protein [Niveomyces insectorum RCEF 264]|uniref:Lsm domain containing protein n=1 Tax=Niveomyces insectorum RCEF 264 TaxID=1081102 RepID=A0A167Y8Z4_9HYPO|nr:lsm domain containing protein [Niveomyces insectorum RCEF 264]
MEAPVRPESGAGRVEAVPPTEAPAASPASTAVDTASEAGREYLRSLLNKYLLIHTTDGRMFRGEFMCTDPDYNIVLAHATEYRQPSARKRAQEARQAETGATKVVLNMTPRYLGLIVVPGQHIVKIELEEFASQMKP